MTKQILLSADAADGLITISHNRKTTVFLPKNSDHLISKHSLADTNLLRQILLCSSVEVNDHVFFFRKKNFMLVTCLCNLYRVCTSSSGSLLGTKWVWPASADSTCPSSTDDARSTSMSTSAPASKWDIDICNIAGKVFFPLSDSDLFWGCLYFGRVDSNRQLGHLGAEDHGLDRE